MKSVRILRVDPGRRTIATMHLKGVKDCTPQIRRLIRSNKLGSREILKVDGAPVMCVAGLEVDEAMQGWRLRGGEDTGGIAILTGRDETDGNLLVNVPISRDWLLERIQWLDGEDVDGRDARADEMLPALDPAIRRALAYAVPVPNGDVWISAADKAKIGEAMVTLGLGTERSGGQMLTKLGETMHDKVVFGGSLATADAAA